MSFFKKHFYNNHSYCIFEPKIDFLNFDNMILSIKSLQKHIFLAMFSVLLLACNSQQKKEDLIDFNTLSKASDYTENQKETIVSTDVNWYDSLIPYNKLLFDSLKIADVKITLLDTTLFPDRFGALQTQKFNLENEDNLISFYTWDFKDSLKTKTAFYNWLDCFGLSCKSIRLNEEVKLNSTNTCILVYPTKLIYSESKKPLNLEKILISPETKKNQKEIQKPLYIVFQAKGKKAKWLKVDAEGKLIK